MKATGIFNRYCFVCVSLFLPFLFHAPDSFCLFILDVNYSNWPGKDELCNNLLVLRSPTSTPQHMAPYRPVEKMWWQQKMVNLSLRFNESAFICCYKQLIRGLWRFSLFTGTSQPKKWHLNDSLTIKQFKGKSKI